MQIKGHAVACTAIEPTSPVAAQVTPGFKYGMKMLSTPTPTPVKREAQAHDDGWSTDPEINPFQSREIMRGHR